MARECPECGTKHALNSNFCCQCGAFMTREFDGHPSGIGESCQNCGHPIRAGANYCTSCGVTLKKQ